MRSDERQELIDAIAGQAQARERLIERHAPAVYGLVSRMLVGRDPSAIDDVAQDSLLRTLTALHRFDPDGPAKVSSWMLTIATRRCIDELRRRPHVALDFDPPAEERLERSVENRQRYRQVARALADLPDDQRAVLVLRVYFDEDTESIAKTLGIAKGTVKSRLSRARESLRQSLDEVER
ncbi:MAG: RNA polymerase sigma factor [Deltaproteobacteria bacterium]|nr:RNA polymerase sigma factor [Deltaproteobacteria bacterium]